MENVLLDTALKAARAAGSLLFEGSRRDIAVDRRMAHDVKLALDRKAEETICAVLREVFPNHAIVAEEGGGATGEGEYEWVVDPLDGTYNLFRGIPAWTTSIGLRRKGEEILGVIYDPSRDEMFWAAVGEGAFLNGRRVRVSNTPSLVQATVATGYAARKGEMAAAAEATRKVTLAADKIRILGSAALHLAYVACGRIDGFYEHRLWPWDISGGVAIIREAGGTATTRAREDGSVDVVCSNGLIQDELARLVGI